MRWNAVVLVAFAALTLLVTMHHEPWRDEADSWLLARDGSVGEIVERSRNSGSPALWYLVLKPFAAAGLPYATQAAVHLILAWSAAALLLFASPFPMLTRVLLLASYYFSYEYAVIARSYVLTVLLLFVALAFPRRPWVYAIAVALMFNANAHGAVIAGALLAAFALRARAAGPLALMAAGAVAAVLQMRAAADATEPIIRGMNVRAIGLSLASAFAPGIDLKWALALTVPVIVVVVVAIARNRPALAFFVIALTGLTAINVLVWFGGYRHAGMILLAAVGALWMAGAPNHRMARILFDLSLAVSVLFALQAAWADYKWDFSGSKEMGTFIRDNDLDRLPIAAHNIYQCEAVLPYLRRTQFWYAATGRSGSYTLLDRAEKEGMKLSYPDAVARAEARFAPTRRPWLLLLNTRMPDPQGRGFRLVYATRGPVYRQRDERYWLYRYER